MSYTIENINGCTKKILFDFESMDLSSQIKSALVKKQKSASIKGFRKGKAPLSIIEKFYRPQVENEALYEFISGQYTEAIKHEKLNPISYPSFSNTKYEPGKGVSFEAVIEIFPVFDVNGLEQLSFQKEEPFVEEKEIETLKERYLNSKSEMVEIQDESKKVEKGLFAVVNFYGSNEKGELLPHLKGEDVLVEIGSGQFLPEFEDGLIGMKKSDKKTIIVTFPENYQEHSLQNQKISFEVEVLELKEKKLPNFNDELAKEFGYESVEDFKKKVKENLLLQKEKEVKSKLFQQILEKLIESTKFDVPNALLMRQKESLKEDLERTLKKQGFNDEMVDEYYRKWDQEMVGKAEFQVRSGLILDFLSRKFQVETLDSDLEKKYEEIAKTSGITIDEIKKYYASSAEQQRNLRYTLREEKTFNKILEFVQLV